MSDPRQFSTFYIDSHHFGVDVRHVQEVVPPMPTANVPLTTTAVEGLLNLRGQIVLGMNLRARLQLAPSDSDDHANVIVNTQGGLVSLRVDSLGDVLELEEAVMEPLPDTVEEITRDTVLGVVQLKDSLLLILDVERLAEPDLCVKSTDE